MLIADICNQFSSIKFFFPLLVPPKLKGPNFETHSIMPNRPAEIECHFNSNPKSSVTWFKDGQKIDFSDQDLIKIFEDGRLLQFLKVNSKDEGHYMCVIENFVGKTEKTFKIDVYGKYPYPFPLLFIIFII